MKKWIYVGVFLDPASRYTLKELYSIPEGWKEYCDHMTVVFNDGSRFAEIVRSANIGNMDKKFSLEVVAVGISEKAMAIKVNLPKGIVCANEIPHITLGVSPEGKPVDSNDITIWNTIEPFRLKGEMKTYWTGMSG